MPHEDLRGRAVAGALQEGLVRRGDCHGLQEQDCHDPIDLRWLSTAEPGAVELERARNVGIGLDVGLEALCRYISCSPGHLYHGHGSPFCVGVGWLMGGDAG